MRYVLDSSVAFPWVVQETLSAKAEQLRIDFQNAVHELLAPAIFTVELAHALTRAERQGRIPHGQALIAWTDVLRTCPALSPSDPLLPRAIEIASLFRIGVYDCVYVTLAEREKCELLTADDRLVRTLRSQFPFVVPLSSLP